MSIVIVPLRPVPNQSVSCVLNGISHTLEINTRRGSLYLTLWRGDAFVLHNRVLRSYAPVDYGLQLVDTEGTDEPQYEGLGSRWQLLALQATS